VRAVTAACLIALAAAAPAAADVRLLDVGDFDSPVHVTGAPGDGERLYVVEQPGIIRVVRNGVSSQFADLTVPVEVGGNEEGLLSVAFSPDFQASRLLYVFFTNADADHDLEIAELRAPTGDAVDPASLRRVLVIEHNEANNHNGGQLQFGPDGYLYISTGDGGRGYDNPIDDAVSTSSLLGKILRIDPRGGDPGEYTVPPDNPFGNEVWSYGLRNPWRFSFDRSTGDMTIGDVGQHTVEEVNSVPASAGAGLGAFFGWDECEGNFDVKDPEPPPGAMATAPCTLTGDVRPAISLLQADGFCSVIGGYVVRDSTLPSLLGRYVYSDLCVGRLRSAVLGPAGASDDGELDPELQVQTPTSFGEDAGGCLYVASRAGDVYRIVENDTRIPCQPPAPPPDGDGNGGGGSTGGGAGAGGGAQAQPTDVTGPHMQARVKRRQRVLHLGGVIVYVSCDERCSVAAGGWIRIGRRIYRLQRIVQSGQATPTRRIKVRLTAKGRRALRRALAEGRRPRVRVGLRARDALGNPSPLVRYTVRVRP
jgi:glucose/arabinose dehydrogenase